MRAQSLSDFVLGDKPILIVRMASLDGIMSGVMLSASKMKDTVVIYDGLNAHTVFKEE